MNELKSLTLNGVKYDSFPDQTARQNGGSAKGAVLYTEQTLTDEQKSQARVNIGAVDTEYVDGAINEALRKADLDEFELLGSAPQYLAGADTRYNVTLDVKEETEVSITSDTVAEMASGTDVTFENCEETAENGVHTLTCNMTVAWYQIKKSFILDNLAAGEKYKILFDFVASDRTTGYPGQIQIADKDGQEVLASELFSADPGIKTFSFTAPDTKVKVRLYPTGSGDDTTVEHFIQYRDIWINRADARELRTDIYNLSAVTSERLDLKNIGGGVNIVTVPSVNIYTQVVEGDVPDGYLKGKTCVCFGDSITGNYDTPFDYPSVIARKTGMNAVNGGFGGCRMAQHPTNAYNAFSMHSLADSVASGDWSVQNAAVASVSSANAAEHLESLKTVDWSAVDYITIFYGTNDFTGGITLDDENNSQSTAHYKGALRYSVEKILTAYPRIRIVVITPIYRYWTEGGTVTDSDTYENAGLKLTDFVKAAVEVAEEYKIPAFDLYSTLGINKINRATFLTDGVHPSQSGIDRIGESIAARLMSV